MRPWYSTKIMSPVTVRMVSCLSSALRTSLTTPRPRSSKPPSCWHRLALRNVMIKVPATEAGVLAIEELTARGVNVNVTLLFSVDRYEQVIEAFLSGLERRLTKASRSPHSDL